MYSISLNNFVRNEQIEHFSEHNVMQNRVCRIVIAILSKAIR